MSAPAPFTAADARDLTERNVKGPVIGPLLKHVYGRIQLAARAGHSSITHPFNGLSEWPHSAAQEALWNVLRAQGYRVSHRADPDPGHPASSPYDEVSWG